MLRRLIKERVQLVQEGRDPMGTLRDPARNRVVDLDVYHEAFGLQRA